MDNKDLQVKTESITHALIRSTDDISRIAKMFSDSGMFPDSKSIAQCAVKILAGHEMGIPPFAAMTGIHLIQGKPTLGANLMASKVKQSGKYDYKILYMEDDGCELEFTQNGKLSGKSKFTKEDATAAGLLSKSIWKQYAKNMYFSRAMSNGVRWYCADVFLGSAVYTQEELGNAVSQEVDVTPVDEFEEVKKVMDSYFETMRAADTLEEVRELFKQADNFAKENNFVRGREKVREVAAEIKDKFDSLERQKEENQEELVYDESLNDDDIPF